MRFRRIIKWDGGLKKYLYNCWENCHIKPVRLLAPIMIRISSEYPLHTHTHTHTHVLAHTLGSFCPFLFVLCASCPLPISAVSLVWVLVLEAAVSPEVKQSAVIYQCVIGPIWEPERAGPGPWRRAPQLIKFQSSAMMNVKKLHPR